MAVSNPEIKAFQGLFSQANTFSVPDGALEIAENVVIAKDGVISKRRGFYQYYDPSSDTLNNLAFYASKLFGIFSDKIGYFTDAGSSPNYTGTRSTNSGVTVAVTNGRVSRTAQANINLYFTTDNGVLKLEAYNSSVYKAGTPPATDLRSKFLPANGQINAETQVAWRVVFGRRDTNDNLLLGSPSDIIVLTNSKFLAATYTRSGGGPYTVTVTYANHNLSTGMSITVSGGSSANVDGTQTVTVTSSSVFTFSVAADPTASGTLNFTATRKARLEFSVPSEITTTSDGYFYQIYRSSQSSSSTVSPVADFKLIDEVKLTSDQITASVVFYDDDTDDILLGAELYTNPNSREGELQANDRPPLCDDMTLYKDHVFYAKCNTRHLIDLQLVDVTSLANNDYIETKVNSTTRRYVARTGVGNSTVTAESATGVGTITVTYTAHGFVNGDVIYPSRITGTLTEVFLQVSNVTANTFDLVTGGLTATALDFQGAIDATSGKVTGVSWTRTSNVVTVTSTAHGLTSGAEVSVTNSSGGSPDVASGVYTVTVLTANTFTILHSGSNDSSGNTLDYAHYMMFQLDTTSASASVKLRNTAQGIVKAINRDANSLVYARYTSGITDIPGKFRLQAKGFTGAIYLRASGSTPALAFNPIFPTSFASGDQVYSRNDNLPNFFYSSKVGEPEAVPLVNYFPVGAKNKNILRIVALRDSVIVIKEDGIFRVNGTSTDNFQVTALDTTVFCLSANSVALLNNQVLCLTNQGVCLISDNSVQIISRKIEDPIQAILGSSNLVSSTSGCGYESDRTYLLTTLEPNGSSAGVTYMYNVINDTWTTSDALFSQALVGPSDTLYLVTAAGKLAKERKNQSRIDYCGQNYSITVTSVASGNLSAVIVSASAVPEAGDAILKSSTFSRIKSVTDLGSNNYTVVFERATNLEAADSVILYSGYTSTVKIAPFHAGLVGRMKQVSEIQIHLRDPSISVLLLSHSGAYFGGSSEVIWRASNIGASGGWGGEPWGFFPWGLGDGINNQYGTQAAPIIRSYIPLEQQRVTFTQCTLQHVSAGEAMNIQTIAYTVRGYAQRVSK